MHSSSFPLPYGYHASIIIAFAIIGFGLKYIDDAFDEELFSKNVAVLMAPILVLIWVCLCFFDSISATVLFSILLAVLLSGKVDNVIFIVSSITLLVIIFLTRVVHFSLIPLLVLTVMGIVDEKGNDYVDSHKTSEVGEFFFSHRCGMKVGTLSLCIATLLPWLYLVAFLAFDTAYEVVRLFRVFPRTKVRSNGQKASTCNQCLEEIHVAEPRKSHPSESRDGFRFHESGIDQMKTSA